MWGPIAAFLVALQGAAPAAAPVAADWGKDEVKQMLARVQAAVGVADGKAQMEELVAIAGAAYRTPRGAGESTDAYARRSLVARDPDHPNVKQGTWHVALLRRFYDDLSRRTDTLQRFERDHRETQMLKTWSETLKGWADEAAKQIVTKIDGVEGAMAPLPIADGDPLKTHGATAIVRGGKVTIEQLDRITFTGDSPPDGAERTAEGSLRELFSSLRQYNISAQMLGQVEKRMAAGYGHVRVFIPAATPSIYLNEIARAAKEAGMRTLLVMTTAKGNKGPRELPVALVEPKAKGPKAAKKKPKKGAAPEPAPAPLQCGAREPMQSCVDKIMEIREKGGAPTFVFGGDT